MTTDLKSGGVAWDRVQQQVLVMTRVNFQVP
jgi:hypothetical protein